MDSFLGRFSLSEFIGLVVPGAVAAGGVWWAFAGVPKSVGAVAALALLVVFYVAGNLLQSLATVLGRLGVPVLASKGGQRTARLVDASGRPLSETFVALLEKKVEARGWPTLAAEPARVVALARAQLRARKLDQRAETLLAQYFFARGLALAALVVALGSLASLVNDWRWSRLGMAFLAVAAFLLAPWRAEEYDGYYADHLWSDFAVAPVPPA